MTTVPGLPGSKTAPLVLFAVLVLECGADVSAHRAFFGRHIKFNQDFNGLVCLAADLRKPRESGDQGAARLGQLRRGQDVPGLLGEIFALFLQR